MLCFIVATKVHLIITSERFRFRLKPMTRRYSISHSLHTYLSCCMLLLQATRNKSFLPMYSNITHSKPKLEKPYNQSAIHLIPTQSPI